MSIEMRIFNLTIPTPRHWKLGAIFAFLLLISFSPAHAMRAPIIRDGGYLSVSGGAAFLSGESSSGLKFSDLYDPGLNIAFAIGSDGFLSRDADLGVLVMRFEGMLDYSLYEHRFSYSVAVNDVHFICDKSCLSTYRLHTLAYQANAYLSLLPLPFSHDLFLGFGLGGATVILSINNDVSLNRSAAAGSLSVGYRYFIKDSFALGVLYRALFVESIAPAFHSITASATLYF